MANFQKEFRKMRKSGWLLPAIIAVVAIGMVASIAGGLTAVKKSSETVQKGGLTGGNSVVLEDAEHETQGQTGTITNAKGSNGTLYSIDGAQQEYAGKTENGTEITESGYATDGKNTGTNSRLQEMQEQLDALEKDNKQTNNAEIETEMRGKVDYDSMNKTVKEATESVNKSLESYQSTSSNEHNALRNTIATNKADTDAKIKELQNSMTTSTSGSQTLQSQVKDNMNTTKKLVTDLEKSTTEKINQLKNTVDSSVNTSLTNITNNINQIQSGSTAVLIGTYDNSDPSNPKFTIKGGN